MEKITVTFVSLLLLTAVLSGCMQEEVVTNEPPSVAVTSPYDGQTLSGVVYIRGTASDPDGSVENVTVSILNYRMEGIHILNVTGTSDWQCQWDTTQDVDGQYTISVRCYDNNGSYSEQEYVDVILANNVSNHAPVADFTFEADGLTVSFTDHSYDVDNDSLEYRWMFGHQYSGPDTTQQNPVHTFPSAGTYTVTLTVEDDAGADASASVVVTVQSGENNSNFSIACWNLQIFGPTKGSNETLLDYYADKFDDYDLFIVQEIRDKSGEAIKALASRLPAYNYVLSERAGRSSVKEQYAVFYNSRATLVSTHDYTPAEQDDFERPPYRATFTVNNWTFTLYTIHVDPDVVPTELSNLETIVGSPTEDTIVIGDLNADGSYYDEKNRVHFTTWNWVITNDMDTTAAASDNTYDRIIINTAATNNFLSAGVMDDVTSDQSDHYLVYAVFNTHSP